MEPKAANQEKKKKPHGKTTVRAQGEIERMLQQG
jgi:hypothetical protein